MSIETAADRVAFLSDFGLLVSWQIGAGAPASLTAIFDGGTLPQDLQGGGMLNSRATLTLRAEDLPVGAGGRSDTIVINTIMFHPKAVMPDGQGMVVVTLEQEI